MPAMNRSTHADRRGRSSRDARQNAACARRVGARGPRCLRLEQLESRNLLAVSGLIFTDTIYPAGDRDAHFFDVTSQDLAAAGGQYVVTLAVSGGLDRFQPRVRVESPDGRLVGGEISAGSSRVFVLTESGRYTVRVQDNDDGDTGTYALALEGINPPSLDAQQIALGELKSSRLDEMGEVDAYTFTATAGSLVTLSLSKTHPGSRATLYSATGAKVKLYSSSTGNGVGQVAAGSKVRTEPLAAGKYVIQVYDSNYRAVGDYQLALEGLTPPSADAVALTPGQTRTGEIVIGEVDAYKFEAAGNEVVSVSLSNLVTGISTRLWAELYSPSGAKVLKLPGTNGPSEVENGNKVIYRLPDEAGTYVIQVYEDDYSDAEPYGVTLAAVSPPDASGTEIGYGQALTGTIDAPSEVDTFYWALSEHDLTAGGGQFQAAVSLTSETTASYKPRARVFAPTGAVVGQEPSPGDVRALTLTQAGVYTIQVYDNDYTHTSAELADRGKPPQYTVRLIDAQPPTVQSVTVNDSLLTDSDAGVGTFVLTLTYDESMNPLVPPVLTYSSPLVAGGATPALFNPSVAWSATRAPNDTVTIRYSVADTDLELAGIALNIAGGQDTAGNVQQPYATSALFGIDTRNPTVVSLTPRHNAVGIGLSPNLAVTFGESIATGTGTVTIRRLSDDGAVEQVSVSSPLVSVFGATATITPSGPLREATGYYVEISADAFRDLAGNAFGGVAGSAGWRFTTGDFAPPLVTALWPADDTPDVELNTLFRLVFDEPIQAAAGQITIRRSLDGTTAEAIDVAGPQVSIVGTELTISPSIRLAETTSYYIEVASGAIADLAGLPFAGISGPDAWNFTTVDAPPEVRFLWPARGAVGVALDTALRIQFDQPVRVGSGAIVVRRSSDGAEYQTIPVSDGRVAVSEDLVTVALAPPLERRAAYYVEIGSGAFEDLTGNPFTGFTTALDWTFATVGPMALGDSEDMDEDTTLAINVLANDLGAGRPIDAPTLTIQATPQHGTVLVYEGSVIYRPAANFSGVDSFTYTVRDVVGFQSNPATVMVTVAEVPDYQNPTLPEDVNGSGAVTPLDVLIAVNRINGHGSQLPPDPIPPDVPPYYYDVDGNNRLEPVDILRVINYLNRPAHPPEGEFARPSSSVGGSVFPWSPSLLSHVVAPPPTPAPVDPASYAPRSDVLDSGALPWSAAADGPAARPALAACKSIHEGELDRVLDEILPLIAADISRSTTW